MITKIEKIPSDHYNELYRVILRRHMNGLEMVVAGERDDVKEYFADVCQMCQVRNIDDRTLTPVPGPCNLVYFVCRPIHVPGMKLDCITMPATA